MQAVARLEQTVAQRAAGAAAGRSAAARASPEASVRVAPANTRSLRSSARA